MTSFFLDVILRHKWTLVFGISKQLLQVVPNSKYTLTFYQLNHCRYCEKCEEKLEKKHGGCLVTSRETSGYFLQLTGWLCDLFTPFFPKNVTKINQFKKIRKNYREKSFLLLIFRIECAGVCVFPSSRLEPCDEKNFQNVYGCVFVIPRGPIKYVTNKRGIRANHLKDSVAENIYPLY